MKNVLARHQFPIFAFVLVGLFVAVSAFLLAPPSFFVTAMASDTPADAQSDRPDGSVNVTQHHNNATRDGLFIDPAFTLANAANLTRDTNFNGAIVGNVYAQPLYIENGPGGAAMVIAVTNSNNVYPLDATTGNIIWQRNLGASVASTSLPCGNVNPEGILGTPVVDLATRSLYLNALTTPDGGTTKRQKIFSLNVDTGLTNVGWPVDVQGVTSNGFSFDSSVQGERGAAVIVGDRVYFPYGGRFGDCGSYHGWIVGVKMSNPTDILGWATTATGGGAWSVGGISSDGTTPFLATGNTFSTGGTWKGGEAIIRFQAGPVLSGTPATTDFWAPTTWLTLDNGDADLGGTGALLVDVPGATPSQLVVAFGKDRNAYVVNRSNLGGIVAPVAQANAVSSSAIIQAAAAYRTSMGTYVTFRGSSTIGSLRINPTNPPTITSAWSVSQSGRGSPFVTTTDGVNNAIVWSVGSEGSQRLNGYNGDTGAVVYAGGGTNELMTATRRFNTGIAARGSIYLASDNKVYAFRVAGGTPTPTPTNTPTNTPTATATSTATSTNTPTSTSTNTSTPTNTPTVTPTSTPTNTPTDTPAATPTAPSGTISGTVTYANASAAPVFVSNVLMTGAGSPNVSTTTAAPGPIAGQYTLTGFGAGSYVVTPSKTGGANGITSFDSAKVAQHVAGVSFLNANQLIAADASGNGSVSSFDAAQIAQYVVSGIGGHTTEWKFLPITRSYPSVTTPITAEDYTAILIGEVSGNWNNTGARIEDSRQLAEGSEQSDKGIWSSISVTLPSVTVSVDKEIVVPINVDGIAGEGIISYEFDLRYDPSVLQPNAESVDVAGTIGRGLSVVTSVSEPGVLRVVGYGALPIDGNGILLNLRFTSVGQSGSVSPLSIQRMIFNEGLPMTVADGQVELSAAATD